MKPELIEQKDLLIKELLKELECAAINFNTISDLCEEMKDNPTKWSVNTISKPARRNMESIRKIIKEKTDER